MSGRRGPLKLSGWSRGSELAPARTSAEATAGAEARTEIVTATNTAASRVRVNQPLPRKPIHRSYDNSHLLARTTTTERTPNGSSIGRGMTAATRQGRGYPRGERRPVRSTLGVEPVGGV